MNLTSEAVAAGTVPFNPLESPFRGTAAGALIQFFNSHYGRCWTSVRCHDAGGTKPPQHGVWVIFEGNRRGLPASNGRFFSFQFLSQSDWKDQLSAELELVVEWFSQGREDGVV
jgi:hypothetical protein